MNDKPNQKRKAKTTNQESERAGRRGARQGEASQTEAKRTRPGGGAERAGEGDGGSAEDLSPGRSPGPRALCGSPDRLP